MYFTIWNQIFLSRLNFYGINVGGRINQLPPIREEEGGEGGLAMVVRIVEVVTGRCGCWIDSGNRMATGCIKVDWDDLDESG